MKTFKWLLALALVAGLAISASAGWNIKQKEDGGTYWENSGARGATEYHVLRTYIMAQITDASRASSAFAVAPVAGFIEKIYVTLHAAMGATEIPWNFFISSTMTGFKYNSTVASGEITNGTARLTFDDDLGSAAGDMSAFTTRSATTTATQGWWPDENMVAAGGIIGISSGGADSNSPKPIPATIMIVINPKGR